MSVDDTRTSLHDLVDRLSRELGESVDRAVQEWRQQAAAERAAAVEEATAAVRADAERLAAEAVARAREAWQASADETRVAAEARIRAELEARLSVAEGQAAEAVAALADAETNARAGERESKLAEVARLLTAIERLDAGRSLRETLDALADGLVAETGRALVFVVRAGHLRGWRFHGVAEAPDPAQCAVPLEAAGVLGEVVRSRQPAQVRPDVFDEATSDLLRFARHPHAGAGLALPVVVGSDTVALVYADDGGRSDRPVPDVWPEAIEILTRHASRCLEALTVARAASWIGTPADSRSEPQGGEAMAGVARAVAPLDAGEAASEVDGSEPARRFARLVLSEMKLEHETDVKVGRLNRDLRRRLAEPIAAARRRYDDRVPADVPGRGRYFEEELVRTLADGNPAMLGPTDAV